MLNLRDSLCISTEPPVRADGKWPPVGYGESPSPGSWLGVNGIFLGGEVCEGVGDRPAGN